MRGDTVSGTSSSSCTTSTGVPTIPASTSRYKGTLKNYLQKLSGRYKILYMHALSIISLSFSGFAGESSAGDFQDCGVSSMILMGDWMSHPGILLVLKVHLLEAAEICSYTVQGEEEEKKIFTWEQTYWSHTAGTWEHE